MKKSQRRTWAEYFLNLAELVSTRSTCDRLNVGCVITKNNRILTTGYNGSPPGLDHCDLYGHLMVENHCIRTVHAEANAVAQAAQHGVSLLDTECYLTHTPCYTCAKLLYTAGIRKVICKEKYKNDLEAIKLFSNRDGLTYLNPNME